MFKKMLSMACAVALAIASLTTVAFADENVEMSMTSAPSDVKYTETSKGVKYTYATIKVDGLDGKYVTSGQFKFYVTKGAVKSTTAYSKEGWLGGEDDLGDYLAPTLDGYNIYDGSTEPDKKLVTSDYDVLNIPFASGNAMTTSDGNMVYVRLVYNTDAVDLDIIPAYLNLVISDADGNDIETINKYYSDLDYKYVLTGGTTTVKKQETGSVTTPVITPGADQTDYEAAAAFTGYADATKVGSYTGDDNADDKATAFKATVSGTSSTGDVIWKVTDGSTTKYHKMSVGDGFTGGGSAVIGLAVEGLADGSASVAFLK